MNPELATHYSPSMDAYFNFDNACFIWNDYYGWVEYTGIGHIKDLEEINT